MKTTNLIEATDKAHLLVASIRRALADAEDNKKKAFEILINQQLNVAAALEIGLGELKRAALRNEF